MFCIKTVSKEHLDEIAEIENACFAQPWSQKSLELLLGKQATALVALQGGRVVGYVGMTYVLDEGQITNLGVLPEARRHGIGRALMRELESIALQKGIYFLSLEVRESNSAARSLYCSLGWGECGIRKNFYTQPLENAVVMTREIPKTD